MRCAFFAVGPWLAVSCFLLALRSLDAATIEGRVVDSAGNPIAGAEVRIWQKLLGGPNGGSIDRPTDFDGGDVLHTDAEGRFVSPDVLVGEAFARIVVEADGMLAGRCGWIEIRKDAQAKAPDITLKRLRIVIGKVLDRRGAPVDGASVFNSGDGHERVKTTSKGGGKFRLADVPEGGVFLFAEAPGYRFTGSRLPTDETQASLTLTSVDEPAKPLATLPPLLSDERRAALAREILDPWLEWAEESAAGGFWPLLALANLDPVEAFNRADQMQIKSASQRSFLELAMLTNCLNRRDLSLDELRPLIESAEDPSWHSRAYVWAAWRMDNSQELRRREWLALGLLHARRIDDPAQRAQSLAVVAAGLSGAGDDQRAGEVISEAEKLAEQLPAWDQESQRTFRMLALNLAKRDPVRAAAWLEKIEQDYSYISSGGDLAVDLLPEHPAAAEDAWNRTAKRLGDDWRKCHMGERSIQLAEFCYRLAGIDRQRAVQVARNTPVQPLRVRGLGAVALRLAESDPASARQLLESLLHDELPRPAVDDEFDPFGFSYLAPPLTAAWLLPIAERIDPQLARECFWRALALRAPRPRRGPFSDRDVEIDISLTMMLSRYDRIIARALLEPLVARLPEYRAPATSDLKAQHAMVVAINCRSLERLIVSAAAHVDPRWAVKLFETFPPGLRYGSFGVAQALVNTLSKQGANRWGEDGFFDACSANYWQPKPEPAW